MIDITGLPFRTSTPSRRRGAGVVPMILALAYSAAILAETPDVRAEAAADGTGTEAQLRIPTPEEQLRTFRVADGYEVNLYASEADFPLHNPTAFAFDAQGRLWVATSPTFPHHLPGRTPDDKVLILEDRDRDGRADRHTVFADGLLIPTGLAIDTDGLWLAQQPNLLFLRDTDGDDVADERRVVLHGFGTEDSHHSLSAFAWGPDGALYFNEGIFLHSQVETPWGPRRMVDGGVYRFKPSLQRVDVMSHRRYYNPWGHAFDRWGRSVISDASDGQHYNFGAVIANFSYPEKTAASDPFLHRGRPMAGNLFLSSRHFPEEVQETHLNHQSIGVQGVRWDRLIDRDSGWTHEPLPDLLVSPEPSFRPVAGAIGPDGALYILDFCNHRIGHMYFKREDPGRDDRHGRIWRVTAKGRALLEPPRIEGEPVERLLDLLTEHEDHVRHFARRELQKRPAREVLPAVRDWIRQLDSTHPDHEHRLLEALWVCQGLDSPQFGLLDLLLEARDARARAAATRVLRHWLLEGHVSTGDALARLAPLAVDPNARVRLEAVAACGFVDDPGAAGIAGTAADHPLDQNLSATLDQTISVLAAKFGPADPSIASALPLARMEASLLLRLPFDEAVGRAILARGDISRDDRVAALEKLRSLDPALPSQAVVLADALAGAAADGPPPDPLEELLLSRPPAELREAADAFRTLARSRDDRVVRTALAALITATGRLDDALAAAGAPDVAGAEARVFEAVERVSNPGVRDALHAPVAAAAESGAPMARAAALRVLPRLPGHGDETLALVGRILTESPPPASPDARPPDDAVRFAAIAALNAFPPDRWPPGMERFRLREIAVAAVPHTLLFDPRDFTVEAGRPVRLVFRNPDAVPHNLVIATPGSRDKVGQAAAAMVSLPDGGFGDHFIPDLPEVLHGTPLLEMGESTILEFIAPDAPGDYVFVCTFPGHYLLMHGTMKVR